MAEDSKEQRSSVEIKMRYDEKLQKMMPIKSKYFEPQEIIAAIEKSGGFISVAAKSLGVSSNTIYRYIKEYPEISEAISEIETKYLDIAEAELIKSLQSGNLAAVIFFLKTKGKKRGYIERSEMTGINGTALANVIQINVVDATTKDEIDKLRNSSDKL